MGNEHPQIGDEEHPLINVYDARLYGTDYQFKPTFIKIGVNCKECNRRVSFSISVEELQDAIGNSVRSADTAAIREVRRLNDIIDRIVGLNGRKWMS